MDSRWNLAIREHEGDREGGREGQRKGGKDSKVIRRRREGV